MTTLHELYEVGGQSPWIDDLKRSYVAAGGLERLIASGIRGVTSNPTIMAKSISGSDDYDGPFAAHVAAGMATEELYWELVLADVTDAADLFLPLHHASNGGDGFVSVEVSPALAHDTAATLEAARALHERVNRPNVLIKIPATRAGLPAIEEMIAEGRSVNVTLIFSLERYGAVLDAYERGLARLSAAGGDLALVASVASFFVSRVDTEVDRRLEAIAASDPTGPAATRALALRGKAALAQARLAYAQFQAWRNAPGFAALAARGARPQRPLWASTSTKNPTYPDLLYVDGLVGPDTVNTMPAPTVDAFLDHGRVERTIDAHPGEARAALDGLAEVGIDLQVVTDQLEAEGVAAFAASFDELLVALEAKAAAVRALR